MQVTPPGSACSIGFGAGLPAHEGGPGSVRGLHHVVADTGAGGVVLCAGLQDPDGDSLVLQEMPWRTSDAF